LIYVIAIYNETYRWRYFFYFIGNFSYKAKTLGGMRTRLIGKALGAASLQADSLFHQIGFIMGS